MRMFSKVMLVTELKLGESCHVFMRTPFMVLVMKLSLTTRPRTSPSFGYFPRLPTLMPWPGPHQMFEMRISVLPCPIEMQSSPVPIRVSWMMTPELRPMWMPSVLGLSSGASMRILLARKFWHCNTLKWKCFGFTEFTLYKIVSSKWTNFTCWKKEIINHLFKIYKFEISNWQDKRSSVPLFFSNQNRSVIF